MPTEVLPQELDQDYFNALDAALAKEEERQFKNILDQQEEHGFLNSGQTFRRASEEVLGPAVQRRQGILASQRQEAALRGREERLGETGFQRQRQFAQEEFGRDLERMAKQASIQKQLMELEDFLTGRRTQSQRDFETRGGFFGQLGRGILPGLGQGIGAGVGQGIGKGLMALF